MINIENLTKTYGEVVAVDDISFTVRDGEILGFLGPNGAGKTTTMKMMTCYMPPDHGSIKYNDLNIKDDSMEIRKRIGYLPENAPLYEYKSVREYLDYICDLRAIHGARRKQRIDAMIETCGLQSVTGRDIGNLSKGFRQRVGIAQALIHEPEILILDEPTVGLDPNQIVDIRNLIKEIGKEKTVILSTHILSEVEATCDRVVIIAGGKITADGSPETLRSQMAGNAVLHLEFLGDGSGAKELYSGIEHVESVTLLDPPSSGITAVDIAISGAEDVREQISKATTNKKWTILEMHQQRDNLEDVFRKLTQV